MELGKTPKTKPVQPQHKSTTPSTTQPIHSNPASIETPQELLANAKN